MTSPSSLSSVSCALTDIIKLTILSVGHMPWLCNINMGCAVREADGSFCVVLFLFYVVTFSYLMLSDYLVCYVMFCRIFRAFFKSDMIRFEIHSSG